jgi:hypothetical protein
VRALLAVTLAFASFAGPVASAEATTSKRRSCGTIKSTSVYPYARVVAIRGVSCTRAREVAKAYDSNGRTARGWRCALAHGDRPRLFSCGSRAGRGDLRNRARALEAIGSRRAEPAKCRSVSYGGRTYVLAYRGLGCRSARRKVRYVHAHKSLAGWKCRSGSGFRTGGSCKRGASYFAWHPGD